MIGQPINSDKTRVVPGNLWTKMPLGLDNKYQMDYSWTKIKTEKITKNN